MIHASIFSPADNACWSRLPPSTSKSSGNGKVGLATSSMVALGDAEPMREK